MNSKTKFLTLSGLLALSLSTAALAQERIQAVEVQGNRSVDSAIILEQIYQTQGKTFSRQTVSEDVARIYRLGYFEDIQVDKSPTSGGVKLTYQVQERSAIQEIVIEGNKKLKEAKIREAITVKANTVPDNLKIAESREKIQALLNEEGYNEGTVQTEIRQKDGKSQLVFKVQENEGAVVRRVNFEGNTVFSDFKLGRMVKTKKKNFLSFLTGAGKFRQDMLDRDVAFITYNYLNKGYLRVRVGQPRVEFSEKEKGMVLTFSIDEGSQYRVGEMSFEGDVLTTKQELQKLLDTMQGNIYSQQMMEEDIVKLNELYGNQGYAFTNIVPQTNIHDDSLTADINFKIDKAQKVYVEKINITGNSVTRDKVIRRELKVVENSLYNEKLIKLSKRKLEQLGFFETVEIATPRGSSDDKLVLNVNVKEKSTGTFSVGGGYSSAESFLLTASISKNNFFGKGISGSLSAEVSGRRQQFSAQYTNPYFLDTNWIFSANGFRINSDYEDFRRKSFGGGVEFGRRLFDFSSVSLGYQIEDVSLDDFDLVVPEFFRENSDGLTSSIIASYRRDTRNNPITTTKGTYNSLTLEYAGNGLSGDNDFFRVSANTRLFYPIWGSSVLRFNGRLGYIRSMNDEPVPLFERFFTGGINSLRGFELRSVGPTLTIPNGITGKDENFVYGGDKLLLFNLEYEFPIYEPAGFRGVVFFDAGNAFAENETLNPIKLRTDVGAGVRWISPFGPLRFEWGFPLDRRDGEKRSVFNFTIGSFF